MDTNDTDFSSGFKVQGSRFKSLRAFQLLNFKQRSVQLLNNNAANARIINELYFSFFINNAANARIINELYFSFFINNAANARIIYEFIFHF